MIGKITALACVLCRAVTGVLTKFLSGRIEPFALNFVCCAGAAFFICLLIPFYPGLAGLWHIPAASLLLLVFSALPDVPGDAYGTFLTKLNKSSKFGFNMFQGNNYASTCQTG